MASIYKNEKAKSNPYWFQIMVDDKRVTKRGFRTKGDAKKAMDEIATKLNKGEYVKESSMTYAEYFTSWLDLKNEVADSTREMYESYFRIHIEPFLGKYLLSNLGPLHIQKFIKHIKDKGLSDQTVKRVYSVVNASLNAAVRMEILTKNVADKVDKPKVKRTERLIWSEQSIKEFLERSRGQSRYWIAIFLAVMTGMRQGEILGLMWSDIDFDKRIIYVRRNLRKDRNTYSELKTEKSRRQIHISPDTTEMLKEQRYKQEIEKKYAILKGTPYDDNGLVVATQKGTPAKSTKVLKAWKTLCHKYKPAHEPDMTFHDLRHLHASILVNDNHDIVSISQRLGHSNVTTTLNTYSHTMVKKQEAAAVALDKIFDFGFRKSDKASQKHEKDN